MAHDLLLALNCRSDHPSSESAKSPVFKGRVQGYGDAYEVCVYLLIYVIDDVLSVLYIVH